MELEPVHHRATEKSSEKVGVEVELPPVFSLVRVELLEVDDLELEFRSALFEFADERLKFSSPVLEFEPMLARIAINTIRPTPRTIKTATPPMIQGSGLDFRGGGTYGLDGVGDQAGCAT